LSAPVSLPLSVVIVAKNEAANLPRCLASVRGWTAGVVVALNATTDASEALALAAGAQVHHLPWQGFRDTKNAALALATQPWALCLDADEEVSPALRAELIAFFARPDHATFAGVRFPRKVWFLGRWITHGDWYPDLSLRLVHRARARWGGDQFVHESAFGGDLSKASLEALLDQIRLLQHQAACVLAHHQPITLLQPQRAPQRRWDHHPPLATQAHFNGGRHLADRKWGGIF
jgi:glycosyltransferase involved in cell wall biosynthesis